MKPFLPYCSVYLGINSLFSQGKPFGFGEQNKGWRCYTYYRSRKGSPGLEYQES